MTLVPPASIPSNSLALGVVGFPAMLGPFPNVQPFSYQDGLTFQKLFESYRHWILNELVPHVDRGYVSIVEAYNAASQALDAAMSKYAADISADRDAFNALVEESLNDMTAAITANAQDMASKVTAANTARTAAEAARDSAQQWAANTQALQDTSVSSLIKDPASKTNKTGTDIRGLSVIRQRYSKAKPSAVAAFQAALGMRFTTPCDIVAIGDSYMEGEGATARDFRFIDSFRNRLRAMYPTPGVPGGANYKTAAPIIASYPKEPIGSYFGDFRFGFGKRASQLQSGAPMAFNVAATSIRIAYLQDTATGTFSYSVNGGTAVNVSTTGPHDGGKYVTVSGLSGINDTITLNNVIGYVLILGIFEYNRDEAKGVRVYESGHFGWTANDFINNISGGTPTDWMAHISLVQPDMVIIELGENDARVVSATQFQTNMQQLISNIRANTATDPSIILIAGPERNDTLLESWDKYVNALVQIAAADTKIDCLDLRGALPSAKTGATNPGWFADSVHPTNKGHSEIATALVEFITP